MPKSYPAPWHHGQPKKRNLSRGYFAENQRGNKFQDTMYTH